MIQEIDQTQDVESTPHLHVRVMSFNVRYATAEDGENHWETRRELAVQRIHAFQPDLLGVQECQDEAQVAYLKEHLPEYAMAGVRRGGSEHLMGKIVNHADLEMTAVFYREAAFELVGEGTFWLSKTPDMVGSKSWGSMFPRTVTWVRLKHRHAPFGELCFFNAHFDHFSRRARRKAAEMLSEQMLAVGNIPVILTGDFNTLKDFAAYKTFVNAGFRDAYRQLHAPGRMREGTFHDYGRIPPMAIDWIFVSNHFNVVEAEIDRFHVENRYPSDHYPVTVTLAL